MAPYARCAAQGAFHVDPQSCRTIASIRGSIPTRRTQYLQQPSHQQTSGLAITAGPTVSPSMASGITPLRNLCGRGNVTLCNAAETAEAESEMATIAVSY